jgi:hypothetical protein
MFEYIQTKDAAKMVRAALKRAFPGVKFSVRTESYSMGSHLEVKWTDGPPKRAVRDLVDPYSGDSFDGMIDMRYSTNSWLLPDGSVVYAGTSGTVGSMGSVPAHKVDRPDPDAKLVHFHGSMPSLSREISPVFEAKAERAWKALTPEQHCVLWNEGALPHWDGVSDGRRLAEIIAAA